MLMRNDTFRELDRVAQQALGALQPGTWSRPTPMPMEAYRNADEFVAAFDLPGVPPEAIEIEIERNVLTIRAERRPLDLDKDARVQVSERTLGVFSRQVFLGDAVDPDRIEAGYDNGVLTVRMPVRDQAKPRKVAISGSSGGVSRRAINA